MPITNVALGEPQSLEELTQRTQAALDEIVRSVNQVEAQPLNGRNRRVAYVADPGDGGDAVNLRTLWKYLRPVEDDGPIQATSLPPTPNSFTLTAPGDGHLWLEEITFSRSDPTPRIGSIAVFHVNELADELVTLSSAVDGTQTAGWVFSTDTAVAQNYILYIDQELVFVEDAAGTSGTRTVRRAQKQSVAGTHTAGTPVYYVDLTTFLWPFNRKAFPYGAGSTMEDRIWFPSQLVVAAGLTMHNERGSSKEYVIAYTTDTASSSGGLRTLSGKTISLFAPGSVTVANNIVPPGERTDRKYSFGSWFVEVDSAVTSATTYRFNANGTAVSTCTITASGTMATAVNGQGFGWVDVDTEITLDCLGGGGGSDARATIRL